VQERTMETIGKIAEILFGVLCAVGWIAGVIAWVRRGLDIPRVVHATAVVSIVVGAISVAIAFKFGIRSVAFTAFALLGFPAWAYAGWFLLGCPGEDEQNQHNGYDLSGVLEQDKKSK